MKQASSRRTKVKPGIAAGGSRNNPLQFGKTPRATGGPLETVPAPYWPHPPEVVGRRTW